MLNNEHQLILIFFFYNVHTHVLADRSRALPCIIEDVARELRTQINAGDRRVAIPRAGLSLF